jgi:uncharacterized protein (DUF1499 family)
MSMRAPRPWLALFFLLLLAACGGLEPGSVRPADMPDPTTLARTGRPNDWLICPASACRAEAGATAPAYPVPPAALLAAWRTVLTDQPRATLLAEDPPRLLLLAQDRTPVLRFVDTVAIRVLPAADGGSTFAAYSRSELGYGDFGTNRRRLESWVAALDRGLAAPR